jgi:DNA mismatch repair protein MutS
VSDLTPMMQQYLRIKETVGEAILMFRIGDFYEMLQEDRSPLPLGIRHNLDQEAHRLGKDRPAGGRSLSFGPAYIRD